MNNALMMSSPGQLMVTTLGLTAEICKTRGQALFGVARLPRSATTNLALGWGAVGHVSTDAKPLEMLALWAREHACAEKLLRLSGAACWEVIAPCFVAAQPASAPLILLSCCAAKLQRPSSMPMRVGLTSSQAACVHFATLAAQRLSAALRCLRAVLR